MTSAVRVVTCASPLREMEFCSQKMTLSTKENFPMTGPSVERSGSNLVLSSQALTSSCL